MVRRLRTISVALVLLLVCRVAHAQTVEAHLGLGTANYHVTAKGSKRYWNAVAGVELRADKVGCGIGTGVFVGKNDGSFILQTDCIGHFRLLHSSRTSLFAGGGYTALPEHPALHVKGGLDRWIATRIGLRVETEILRRLGGNNGWIYVLRIGPLFR